MRVFVTGGTGLVGRHTVARLVARGDDVVALARSGPAAAELAAAGATSLRGRLDDTQVLEAGVAGADAIVHAAAVVLSSGDWAAFHAANVAPVERLARLAARAGSRLVHLSSVAVYGRGTSYDGGPGSVGEDSWLERPVQPGDLYARSKREAEVALWRVAEETGLRAAALRPCVIYGEGDRHFSPRLAAALRLGRGVATIIGSGSNTLSVIYAGNVAAAVVAAIDHPDATGPFNVANDGTLTQLGFFQRFAAGLGVRLRPVRVPRIVAASAARALDLGAGFLVPWAAGRPLSGAVRFLSRDNPYLSARAERELAWHPQVAASEAVERTARGLARSL